MSDAVPAAVLGVVLADTVETAIGLGLAVFLLLYLVVALVFPERF